MTNYPGTIDARVDPEAHPSWCMIDEVVCEYPRTAHPGPGVVVFDNNGESILMVTIEQGRDDVQPMVSLEDLRNHSWDGGEIRISLRVAHDLSVALDRFFADLRGLGIEPPDA